MDTTLKTARMELKTTNAAKELLSMAAAMDKARKVLTEHANISLTREGQAHLASILKQPALPTDAIRDLMAMTELAKA